MYPSAAKKLPWESNPFFLESADEQNLDVIVEEGFLIPHAVHQRQIAEAHKFLSRNGIEIKRPNSDPAMVRDIDRFDIATIRPKSWRDYLIQVSNNASAEVRKFPADNTSMNEFKRTNS